MSKEKLKIEKLFCFVSENEEGEGIVAMYNDGSWYPMVGTDDDGHLRLLPIAKRIAIRTNRKVKLLEFSTRDELLIIGPDTGLD